MTSTSEPSQAQPGLYALQMTVGAVKQVPTAPHPPASGNPHTLPLEQSASLAHPVLPSLGLGHEPTSQEHDPAEMGSHTTEGEPPPGQAATGGGAPQSHVPASPGAQIAQRSHPFASFCGITPYMQSGRLQMGAGGQASAVEPESGAGPQIGHVGHPSAFVAVPVEPYGHGTQGRSLAAHASVGQAGKPQPQ